MDSIRENALSSLEIGAEDFLASEKDGRRALSAVRNIVAGMLLLFKEKLRALSPEDSNEVLLKQKIVTRLDDAGNLKFYGSGRTTVNVKQIEERFKGLNIVVDWKRVEKVIQLRNEIEHYRTDTRIGEIRELVAGVVPVLDRFMREHLDMVPAEALAEGIWDLLNENAQVFEKQLAECQAELKEGLGAYVDASLLPDDLCCTECGSRLVRPVDNRPDLAEDTEIQCLVCESSATYSSLAESIIEQHYLFESFEAAKGGGDEPISECNNCSNYSFAVEKGQCLICGEELDYTICNICSAGLSSEEQEFGGLCSYHHHLLSKDD